MGRVAHANRRSHTKTWVSGVRGFFSVTSGLSAGVTRRRKPLSQAHRETQRQTNKKQTDKGTVSKKRAFALRPIKTIGEVCRQQSQALVEALILFAHEQLQNGVSATEVFAQLFAKQHPSVALS